MALAWASALFAAVAYGVASVLQAVGSSRAEGPKVLAQPLYVAGLACDGLAWLASLVALRALPLFLVQSVLTASVGVTVLLARFFLGSRLRGRDVAAIVVMVAALGGLAAAFPPSAAPTWTSGGWDLAALLVLALATAAAYPRGGSLLLALLAGAGFAGAAVSARAVDLSGGWASLAGQPLAWCVLGYGVLGTLAYARSLERGPVGPATAVLWSVECVLGGVVGVLVLGDQVRPGWTGVAVVAVALTVLSCGVLATGPAEDALAARAE